VFIHTEVKETRFASCCYYYYYYYYYCGFLGENDVQIGFKNIIIEAGLCASGSIEQVMSGKHYNHAMWVHQRMLETLERMLQKSLDNNT